MSAVMNTVKVKAKAETLTERLVEAGIDPETQLRTILPEEAEQRFWKTPFLDTYNEHMSFVTGEEDATQFASRNAKEFPKDMTSLYLVDAWLHRSDLSGCNISRSIISMEQLLSQNITYQDVDFTDTRVQEYSTNKILDINDSRKLIKERMEALGITSSKGLYHPHDDVKEVGEFDAEFKSFYKKMIAGTAAGSILLAGMTIATTDFNKASEATSSSEPAPSITAKTLIKPQTIEAAANDLGLTIEP